MILGKHINDTGMVSTGGLLNNDRSGACRKTAPCGLACFLVVVTGLLTAFLLSCERPVISEDDKGSTGPETDSIASNPDANLQLSFVLTEGGRLRDACTRLSFTLFSPEGKKSKIVHQTTDDAFFGTAAICLAPDTYTLVAVAHNSTEGNATISSPEKITFAGNKVADTFVYCGTVAVTDTPQLLTVSLQHIVARLCLEVTDAVIPDSIARLKFYYTGGSSTLNPSTTYGCVKSRQTEYRSCFAADGSPITIYDLYTFPHEKHDTLKLVITPLSPTGRELSSLTIYNIPVTQNNTTYLSGSLVRPDSIGGIQVGLNTEWEEALHFTF